MQEFVGWFLASAPNIWVGLVALAALRTLVPFLFRLWTEPGIKRRDAERKQTLAAAKPDRDLSELSEEERAEAAGKLVGALAGALLPVFARFVAISALVGTTIWLFFAVWAVTAELSGIWGESIWWLGVLLEAVTASVGFVLIRRLADGYPKGRRPLYAMWAAITLVFLVLYAFAPLGCLFYAAVTSVLTWVFKKIGDLRTPDSPPSITMVFTGMV